MKQLPRSRKSIKYGYVKCKAQITSESVPKLDGVPWLRREAIQKNKEYQKGKVPNLLVGLNNQSGYQLKFKVFLKRVLKLNQKGPK